MLVGVLELLPGGRQRLISDEAGARLLSDDRRGLGQRPGAPAGLLGFSDQKQRPWKEGRDEFLRCPGRRIRNPLLRRNREEICPRHPRLILLLPLNDQQLLRGLGLR